MSGDAVSEFETKLATLGFERDVAMVLRLGNVKIIGGLGFVGFKLMFTQIGSRSASQLEISVWPDTSGEMVAYLIRSNLKLNFKEAIPLWDDLQQRLRENGVGA